MPRRLRMVTGRAPRRKRTVPPLALGGRWRRSWSRTEGGHFSTGYFSRLERGWGSAPLYTYVKIAEVFDVDPGRLLGPEEVQRDGGRDRAAHQLTEVFA